MKNPLILIICICIYIGSFFHSAVAISASLVTTIPESWQLQLLQQALLSSTKNYRIQSIESDMNQKRKVEELLAGNIDVFWSMTSVELEQKLLPVRIPIFKGLLGNRLLIIRRDQQQRFSAINNIQDFSQLVAGQNHYWPDAGIIQANNLPLVTSYQYKNLYPMLDGGRFDYLALGAQEVWDELEKHPDPNLKVDDRVLLQYRSPAYFFVSPAQADLAKDISDGLESMIADGSFDQLFNARLNIEALYDKARFQQRVIIRLDTPNLDPLTPIARDDLWLDLFSMKGAN